jgi:predicted tellurium resistance membrane protein TerC
MLSIFDLKNILIMRHRDNYLQKHREHHPMVSIGLFFIVLGLALLVATNDMLHLGSVREYFTWETAMVFIGVLLLLNLQFIGGILLIAAGSWFLMDRYYGEFPEIIKTLYWPAVIMLIGISFIISSLFKRSKNSN